MSKDDVQFIRDSLSKRWKFWLYFWRIPRLIQTMCDEMERMWAEEDRILKERNDSVKANKSLLQWVHVTHRLSTTPDAIRALFAAGKRLRIILFFAFASTVFAAPPPPLVRNYLTTNQTFLQVGALTNNGLDGWGFFNLTNLATASDQIWTNDGTAVMIAADTNRVRHLAVYTEFGTNNSHVVRLTNGAITAHGYLASVATDNADSRPIGRRGGITGASFSFATNCTTFANDGSFASGYFENALGCDVEIADGGNGGAFFTLSTNCEVTSIGGMAFGYLEEALSSSVIANRGSFSGGAFGLSTNVTLQGNRGCLAFGSLENGRDISSALDRAGFAILYTEVGASNVVANISRGSFATVSLSGITNNVYADNNSFVFGKLASDERFHAPEGAFLVGRDLAGTNNWAFGIHGTNATPFSLAVVNNGVKFLVESNGTITSDSLTASTVLQANSSKKITSIANGTGALTNNGSGTLGWYDLTLLAPATGGAYIATNNGTGWNTTFVTQTNHSQIVFTNGSKIGATATNTLTITNSHLVFSSDNTWDIGINLANRPRNCYLGTSLTVAGSVIDGSAQITAGGLFYWNGRSIITSPANGEIRLSNNGQSDFTRLELGGTTAAFPALGKTTGEGHIRIVDGTGANSTNSLFFGNTVDTTATTGLTMNRQTGRVRLASGSQTFLVTNNLMTANSIVTATVNSDDGTITSVKAIPAAGLLTLKANGTAAADCDLSFFISSP